MEKYISAHFCHAALLLDVSVLLCRLAVCRQWASALLQALQRGGGHRQALYSARADRPSQVCPVWHLKHLRSLLCRGRSDGLDRLALPGAGGPLSNLPGSAWGGEIALKSCWLETLIIMTVLRLAAVLLSAEGSAHLAVMLSQNSQDCL